MITLRKHNRYPYQKVEEAMAATKHVIYVSGVGTGKSFIFLKLLADSDLYKNGRALYIVPQDAIRANIQSYPEFAQVADRVDFINMQQFRTLERALTLFPQYDLVVMDEAHHLGSDIYGKHILEAALTTGVPFLGLTTQKNVLLTDYQLNDILSFDRDALGVIKIFLGFQSKKREIVDFLDELHKLLGKDDFDINTDLNFIRKKKQGDDRQFSTPYTLLDLDYNVEDVVNQLKELKIEEYSETKVDTDNVNPPILYVFGKNINGRLIYIKLKIRNQQKKVVCVSFHYAKNKMEFPYA